MPIREESFRIGCGRYIQGAGYIQKIAEEVLRFGRHPLLIGDDTTLALTRDNIEKSLVARGLSLEVVTHNGTCNDERAQELAELARAKGSDVVIGAGGGVLMDFAKLTAHFAGVPVINIPTSSATCACYAPLSVRYTPEGRTVGTLHYQTEVDAVIADTEILAAQPKRLLLSGVFDALAKFLEIKQRYREGEECPMGLDYAFVMAKHSFDVLIRHTQGCIEDMERGEITRRVEQVIFTALAATGAISGIARGSNQCALAHKFYETTRTLFPETAKPYLHGEIVGVGLLLQNHFNGELAYNQPLPALMRAHGMPCSVRDVGARTDEATLQEYYTRICNSSAIHKTDEAECARFAESLRYFFAL